MDKHGRIGPDHPLYNKIMALTSTVRTMRRMRGKKNPETCPSARRNGTPSVQNLCSTCTRRWTAIQASSNGLAFDLVRVSVQIAPIIDLLKPALLPDREPVFLQMMPRIAAHPATARSWSVDQAAALYLPFCTSVSIAGCAKARSSRAGGDISKTSAILLKRYRTHAPQRTTRRRIASPLASQPPFE